jgi:putative addiction module component (TIGR02574 family)
MTTQELIAEAISLPVEQRSFMVECLLKSLNPPEADIDKKWAIVAKQRLTELHSGKVEAISGDEVFQEIWNRFA